MCQRVLSVRQLPRAYCIPGVFINLNLPLPVELLHERSARYNSRR